MTLYIEQDKWQKLEKIAANRGIKTNVLVQELIDKYILKYYDNNELIELMKISEPSFSEWDNPEDEIYDDL